MLLAQREEMAPVEAGAIAASRPEVAIDDGDQAERAQQVAAQHIGQPVLAQIDPREADQNNQQGADRYQQVAPPRRVEVCQQDEEDEAKEDRVVNGVATGKAGAGEWRDDMHQTR